MGHRVSVVNRVEPATDNSVNVCPWWVVKSHFLLKDIETWMSYHFNVSRNILLFDSFFSLWSLEHRKSVPSQRSWSSTVLGLGCQEKPQSPKPTIRILFKMWCWMGKWETWELFKTCWDKEKTRYGCSDWNWNLGKRVCRGQWGKVSTDQGRLGTREHAWHLHSFYKQGLM